MVRYWKWVSIHRLQTYFYVDTYMHGYQLPLHTYIYTHWIYIYIYLNGTGTDQIPIPTNPGTKDCVSELTEKVTWQAEGLDVSSKTPKVWLSICKMHLHIIQRWIKCDPFMAWDNMTLNENHNNLCAALFRFVTLGNPKQWARAAWPSLVVLRGRPRSIR